MKHSAEYWQKRAEGRMDIYQNNAEEYLKTLKKGYRKAIKDLKEDSNRLIVNYVKANDLSEGQATKLLALFNGQKIRDIDDLVPMDLDDETRAALERFKSDPAYSHRMQVLIDRLNNVDKVVNKLGEDETTGVRSHLKDTAAEAFDRHMFDIQQGTGVGFSFARPDERALRAMINENWTGKRTFSQSIWGHFQTANQTIQKELITSFLTGRSYERTAEALSKRMSVAYNQAERLVRTETTHAAVQGEMATYKEAGIEKYQFLATLDSKTCTDCGALDSKTFPVDEQKPGVNCPPMHAYCRCTTVIPDNVDAERLAKDKEGKYYKVPADMTYEEWRKSLISEGKSGRIISSPIQSRKHPTGKPESVALFGDRLNSRQLRLLEQLPSFDSELLVSKRDVSLRDLAAMTAHTNVEFALFTKGNKRLILRGGEKFVNVDVKRAKQLKEEGYKWSGHTHPGTSDEVRMESDGDLAILRIFNQNRSVIYNATGRYNIFGEVGE